MFLPTEDLGMGGQAAPVRILRDDGVEDAMTSRVFSSYDEAYDVLERFYADLCCSDERIEYSITMNETGS